MNTDKHRWFNW